MTPPEACGQLTRFGEVAIERDQTTRFAVLGVIFFLGAAVLLDLVFMAATNDYWFRQHLSSGITLLVLDALYLAAIYGSWRRKRWGYVVAILLSLLITAATLGAVFFGGDTIGGPPQFVYTITMILIRLLVVFFALSALLLGRKTSS